MCGIIGIIGGRGVKELKSLGLWQNHRGPDDWGEYHDMNVSLGHNRLSILDIEGGHQPMLSENNKYIIVFNGEIYNYKNIKHELAGKGHSFKTHNSDTEVILNGYIEWGTEIFSKLRGMFSLCIYDKIDNIIVLARDPLGIKPLYIYEEGKDLIFSSELKPIINFISNPVFDSDQLNHYFTNRCTSTGSTFFKNVLKIHPGHYYKIDLEKLSLKNTKYYNLEYSKSERDYTSKMIELESLIKESVKGHMISDVPVGIFLSGGVDSSLIASYAYQLDTIESFNIGTKSKFDETPYAKLAAESIGINLKTKYISENDILEKFENWSYHNDDPTGDPSAMALMILSEHARSNGYKVMLSGEGADELFLGYYIYQKYILFKLLNVVPTFFRNTIPLNFTPVKDWDRFHSYFGAGHISNYLEREIIINSYRQNLKNTKINASLVQIFKNHDLLDRLPNDVLNRTDRSTMAYSVETRVPFLIPEIIEFSNSLSLSEMLEPIKLRGKKILKDLALREIPKELVHRKKRGFDIPIEKWIKNQLQSEIHTYKTEKIIPGIDYNGIKIILQQNNYALIWAWIVLEKWYRNWFLKNIKKPLISPFLNKKAYSKHIH